ncbi:hypothetical protein [Pseudodesulfovibrio sp.]|uniref:hypothetical protein n=1 Tax=unclassified Pseudodesulfovibrio TaxID=2661612 RepID=UPI003B002ED5
MMNVCMKLSSDDCADSGGVRHCAVCFAVIPEGARYSRSLEGHCYCEHCSEGFFREVDLQMLRKDCCRLEGKKAIPA